ncbi:hypothetical protein JHK82_033116 [Glycine max]|uniref:Uncharacterized protein n=1 Tax=Glycine soja TaxID=3848 RepID=A0A0B2NPF6_GLYSO|nr:hypothetical protein JHK87_033052 [Glycine soja]KAG4979875.1 hypothetical protein JHK85_033833 [Glycine max]KAG4985516.1 hypothetical protein JHK86_033207 [Glycine max]KAG5118696.1 hypothetical protein JHK82_033116 [Glycine max]KAG5139686.1 hypothetical protein JHK84_033454 [Glycine max]
MSMKKERDYIICVGINGRETKHEVQVHLQVNDILAKYINNSPTLVLCGLLLSKKGKKY